MFLRDIGKLEVPKLDLNVQKEICKIPLLINEKISANRKFSDCVKISKERIGQDRHYNISSNKIYSELNWKTKINLEIGLANTYEWIKKNFSYLKKQKLVYSHKK